MCGTVRVEVPSASTTTPATGAAATTTDATVSPPASTATTTTTDEPLGPPALALAFALALAGGAPALVARRR